MLKEIIDKGKSSKLINSPRVRNTDTKIFYSFGYFAMMYALILSKNRENQMEIMAPCQTSDFGQLNVLGDISIDN